MTGSNILGYITTENETNNTKVLYLPCNKSQFDMALILSEKSFFGGYVFASEFELAARDYAASKPDSRVSFFLNLNSVASFLPSIDKVVVFVGSVTPFLSSDINKIVSVCLQVKKEIYEVPHGLFQSGYNLSDTSSFIHTSSNVDGFGGMLPSITTKKLFWYGKNGFGYPRYLDKIEVEGRVLPVFTLITSNTNWYLYSMRDKRAFFKEIYSYAENNPSTMFIWCPHPAEFVPDTFSSVAMEYRPKNIFIYGLDKDIYFNGLEGSDDLIPYCEYAISTVSTCLLDYEIYNKRVNIFSCEGVERLHADFISKHCFTRSDQISKDSCIVRTGLLKPFDSKKFDSLISQNSNQRDLIDYFYLSSFV